MFYSSTKQHQPKADIMHTLTTAGIIAIRAAIADAEAARDGDSNDDEIDALWAVIEAVIDEIGA